MNQVFLGTIREGKLFLDKAGQYKAHLQSFPNEKRVEVTVQKLTHPRTNQQNRYFHGVVCKLISDSTGTDLEVVKNFLKGECGAKVFFGNTWVPKPTHLMDTLEMVELCDKAIAWAAEFLGVKIPLPGEVTV